MNLIKIRNYSILCLTILIISFSFVFIIKKNTKVKTVSSNIEKLEKNNIEKEDDISLYVDVKGAVKAPGVYKLSSNKIVMDAINSAGGLEEYADTTYINLSKKLNDEMVIYIFSKDDINKLISSGEVTESKNETIGGIIKNDAYIKSDTSENAKNNNYREENNNSSTSKNNNVSSSSINDNNIININKATKEELMNLNGIGESKAQNIINYRIDNGNFKSIEEIKNVTGIGDSIFEKIKNDICI